MLEPRSLLMLPNYDQAGSIQPTQHTDGDGLSVMFELMQVHLPQQFLPGKITVTCVCMNQQKKEL